MKIIHSNLLLDKYRLWIGLLDADGYLALRLEKT